MILEKKSHYSAYKISLVALPEEFQAPAELYRELARRMPWLRELIPQQRRFGLWVL